MNPGCYSCHQAGHPSPWQVLIQLVNYQYLISMRVVRGEWKGGWKRAKAELPGEELSYNLCLQSSLPIIWATSSFSCGVLLMTSWRLLPILWSTSFTLLLFSWVMWRGGCSPGCLLHNTRGDQASRNCRAVFVQLGADRSFWNS